MTTIDQPFVDQLAARLAEREAQLADPATAAQPQKYRELIRDHARLKRQTEKARQCVRLRGEIAAHRALIAAPDTDAELKQLAADELREAETRLPAVEREALVELLPPDPHAGRNSLVEIRAGTGGLEAALFAGDLARMYTKFAEHRGWKVDYIAASASEAGGYKEVVFTIQGADAYRLLQFEGGAHRVQRIPVTEASGRIHTSTATVAVLPEAEELDAIDIKPEDLRIDVYRASGAGGQHVNKTDSAVRITHLPTGLVVASQEERSQHKNRAKAMRVLRSHLLAQQRQAAAEQIGDSRRSQIGSGDRSERIRTYNFPQNRLTDHRINFTVYSLDRVMEGELDAVLRALSEHDLAQRLARHLGAQGAPSGI